ncbi:MAG: alcohol dehydrogenase catalytic domain-containing protein [Oligosphaeraceae bacterium]|nr:alcohol dehydrogenase catalytic domain-containing protein [Oligosphaeraceae bacterium]
MHKKAAVFVGPKHPFQVREYPISAPAPGQVGLELLASGICGTDVHIQQGCLAMPSFPLVTGHEFVGTVAALGQGAEHDAAGEKLQVGDRAVACVALPCGKCLNCRRGETASCLSFGVTYVKDVNEEPHFCGGFAEYLFSPAGNLVKLPAGVDPLAAAACPCGGPTIIRACTYGGGLHSGELVIIQGNGALGLFALAYAKDQGCRVVLIGSAKDPQRLELSKALQPDCFLDYRQYSPEELQQRVSALAAGCQRGDGADVVIETSGDPGAFPLGLQLLRTRGRYFVPGQYSDRGSVSIPPHLITFRALQIIGSGQYTLQDVLEYLQFLARRQDLQPLFRQMLSSYPVSDIDQAMAAAAAGQAIKAVLVPRS